MAGDRCGVTAEAFVPPWPHYPAGLRLTIDREITAAPAPAAVAMCPECGAFFADYDLRRASLTAWACCTGPRHRAAVDEMLEEEDRAAIRARALARGETPALQARARCSGCGTRYTETAIAAAFDREDQAEAWASWRVSRRAAACCASPDVKARALRLLDERRTA